MFRPFQQLLCATLLAVATAASAQQASVPPLVRVVVPVAAGASTDIIARKLAPLLAARLGTNVIVENRAGATGFIGAGAVSKGPKDGSMLLLFSASMITAGATSKSPPLDVVNDLQPVDDVPNHAAPGWSALRGGPSSNSGLRSVLRNGRSGAQASGP